MIDAVGKTQQTDDALRKIRELREMKSNEDKMAKLYHVKMR